MMVLTFEVLAIIRAFIDAKLTPGAFLAVKDDNPVLPFEDCFGRENFLAGRGLAMPADRHAPYEIELAVRDLWAVRPDG